MKLTRRALGKAAAAAVLAPVAGLAQTQVSDTAKRDWLAEARESHAAAARAIEQVEVPMAVEPAFRFQA